MNSTSSGLDSSSSTTLPDRPAGRPMAPDRMSIAFLAPSQDDAPPWPAASSVSPRNPAHRAPIFSRIDNTTPHDDARSSISRAAGPSTSTTTARRHDRDGDDDDRYRRDSRVSTSPSSSTMDDAYAAEENYPGSFRRQPRSPRPTYSEEQRFFVMYARLIQDKTWPVIEEEFAHIFKQRSKGGLCSLYYRIRRSWSLEDVLKSDSNYWTLERRVVRNFSHDFLVSIGYLSVFTDLSRIRECWEYFAGFYVVENGHADLASDAVMMRMGQTPSMNRRVAFDFWS